MYELAEVIFLISVTTTLFLVFYGTACLIYRLYDWWRGKSKRGAKWWVTGMVV